MTSAKEVGHIMGNMDPEVVSEMLSSAEIPHKLTGTGAIDIEEVYKLDQNTTPAEQMIAREEMLVKKLKSFNLKAKKIESGQISHRRYKRKIAKQRIKLLNKVA